MPLVLVLETGDLEFKPFRETYKIITFNMIVGMLYPRPETVVCRMVGFALFYLSAVLLLISVTPLCLVVLVDMWSSWQRRDIINIIRHITVLGPLVAAIFKIMLFFYSRAETWRIISKIDADHARYNTLPETHKVIARHHIQNTQYFSEKCWAITVAITVLIFPLTAIIQTFYNFVSKEEPTKYMVHDLDKPFSPREDRYSTPYFEVMFIYMIYACVLYTISFTGFDSFFGITINHVCMKMELACQTMDDAMLERDSDRRKRRIMDVIAEQNDVYKMAELIQTAFNYWLVLIVVATIFQICNCVYQFTEGFGIDPRYLIFILGTVAHIFVPCQYAAKLRVKGLDVADRMYCCDWEHVCDESARKMITYMIARTQVPIRITAFNNLNIDMELFVSILQSSYSMFTLMRS